MNPTYVQERNGSVHPMPNDSNANRILKSIQDNHSHGGDKSVYHAFKEKHSPKLKDLNKEAAALKPQALKVVEFPDRILQDDGQGHAEVTAQGQSSRQHAASGECPGQAVAFSLSQLSPHARPAFTATNTLVTKTLVRIGDLTTASGQIQAMSRSLDADTDEGDKGSKSSSVCDSPKVSSYPGCLDHRTLRLHRWEDHQYHHHPLVDGHHTKLEPPRSLNVREVAKLSKGPFALPRTCVSAESIGPCSLDISSVGTGKALPFWVLH